MTKLKLFLANPFGFSIFVLRLILNKGELKFKKKLLRTRYSIHPSVGVHLETAIYGLGKITIGENTYFGKNTFVVSNPANAHIMFGKNCRISHGCQFRTEDNDPTTLKLDKPIKNYSNIEIGNNCWIGANVFVRGGVKLGNNVTVGANSVVLSSFPSDVIIGGVPAKILKAI